VQLAGGIGEQRDGLLVAGAGRVLHMVRTRHDAGAVALEGARCSVMRAQAPAAGRRHVDRVADERVPKGESARRAGRPHERAGQQRVERAQRACL
jgi:hypothetical protein